LKKIFEDTAKKCDSDPTYAGLFDDILQIKGKGTLDIIIEDFWSVVDKVKAFASERCIPS
jgi:hypothetical protein